MQDQAYSAVIESDFQINVPKRLIELVPREKRTHTEELESHLILAIEIGLKAISQAGIHLDTDFVRAEFQRFSDGLTNMSNGLELLLGLELTDEDSKLAKCLRDYLSDEGQLSRTVQTLSRELGDPTKETSIPGRIRTILDEHFRHADSPFQRALNIGDEASPLKHFLSDQEKSFNNLREDITTKHATLSESLERSFQKILDHMGFKAQLDDAERAGTRKGFSFEDDIVDYLNLEAIRKGSSS